MPSLPASDLITPWACLAYAVRWRTEFGGRALVPTTPDCSRMRRQAPGLQASQAVLARYAEMTIDADGEAPISFTTMPVAPGGRRNPKN